MALSSQHRHLLKWLLIAGLVAMLETVATSFNLPMLLQNLLLWVQSLGAWGVIVFIVIYGLATILLIPGSLLTLGGGALFGVVWGSIYVFIAALLGSTCAFLIGRYLARDRVLRRIEGNPKFRAISAAVAQEGLKIVFLARLSPIFPFNLLNYAFSVTQVSLKDFVLGSVGMIPATVLYVYIGSLTVHLTLIASE